jgi:hypothetical protein
MEATRPRKPFKPPRVSHVIAVLIELTLLADILAHRDGLGMGLCLGYAWFSATWALLTPPPDE